jgi:hypothetical protein
VYEEPFSIVPPETTSIVILPPSPLFFITNIFPVFAEALGKVIVMLPFVASTK